MDRRTCTETANDDRNVARPISLGDAVEVVRWPCCGSKVGLKFIVNAMEKSNSGHLRCAKCGARHPSELDVLDPYAGWTPVAWLKRIERTLAIPQGTRLV